MDPRPYNYEFRRPRPNNLTYQSYNAYESLYHMGKLQSQYPNSIMRDQYAQKMSLYSPDYVSIYAKGSQQQQEQPKRYEDKSINTNTEVRSRRGSEYSQRSQSISSELAEPQRKASVLSNYGSSSLQKSASQNQPSQGVNKVLVRNDTSAIYKKQQKPFDIINLYSRGPDPLRVYPKLTMENIMLERGIVQNQ